MKHGMFAAASWVLMASMATAQTQITIWGIDDATGMTPVLAEEFAEQKGDVTIDYRFVPFDALNQEYMRAFATRSTPDILMVNTTDTQFYAASGQLLDLTDRIAASDVIQFDEIFPGYQAAVTYEGRIFEVPKGANTLMIYYNKDMAEAAGIDPEAAPESWEQLRDYVARLTDPGKRVFGIAFSATNTQEAPWQWLPFARMAGAEWDNINTEGSVRALTLWRDFVASGQASPEVLVWPQGDAAASFRAGQSAMVIQGSWDVDTMSQAPFEWGLWMLPPEEEGGQRVSAAGDFTYAIPAAAKNPDLAFELIEYIYSQGDRSWNEFSGMPVRPVTPDNVEHPEAYAAFLQQLEYGRVLGPYDKWNDVSLVLQEAIQTTLSGATEPAEALERAAAEISSITGR